MECWCLRTAVANVLAKKEDGGGTDKLHDEFLHRILFVRSDEERQDWRKCSTTGKYNRSAKLKD